MRWWVVAARVLSLLCLFFQVPPYMHRHGFRGLPVEPAAIFFLPGLPLCSHTFRARATCPHLSPSLRRSLTQPFTHPRTSCNTYVPSYCCRQPLSSPLLYRTAWHVPLFPNDLVLKVCLHEDDRSHVRPTLAALDSRGCYLLVLPRGKGSAGAGAGAESYSRVTPALSSAKRQQWTGSFTLPTPPARTPSGGGRGSGSFESLLPPASAAAAAASGRPSTLPVALARPASSSRFLAPSPAAARARAAAAAAVIANAKAVAAVAAAKEAQAVAAAAAAEEAVMVAKAVEAGVAVPWTWRESEVSSSRGAPKDRRWGATPSASTSASPLQVAAAANGRLVPEGAARRSPTPESTLPVVGGAGAGGEREEGGVDVYVWKGARSNGEQWEKSCLWDGVVVLPWTFVGFSAVCVVARAILSVVLFRPR